MCILFVYTGGRAANSYRLILASNRDEFFFRPAKSASIWKEDSSVIGGQDLEPGREGGTWLAASPMRRRIAVLLNLPNVPTTPNAQARGSIVANYVRGNMSVTDYVRQLRKNIDGFNPFNLITIDIGKESDVGFYSNFDDKLRSFKGILGFGNNLPELPLKKVTMGTERFEEIIDKHAFDKDILVDKLLQFLKWDKRHLPDPELAKRPIPSDDLSSVFVNIPSQEYGTRAHTIILVDSDGLMDFYEWTKISEDEWHRVHLQDKVSDST